MGEWISYKLKNFLEQYRETHFVNEDTMYGQITISKFDGVSFRERKIGKEIGRKRQFFINLKKYPHTLLFTRQGVAEGSIGLAPKEVDECIATENMPMFSINVAKVLPELLSYLIKSPMFKNKVNSLTPIGSAQKAIHERDLLELEFIFPKDLNEQMELSNFLNLKVKEIDKLFGNIEDDIINLNLLHQTILQEAIEGKLTADWRKQNPVRKGDPDTDAIALLEKIKQEKQKMIAEGKIKKEKPLEPIKPEEIPFELPEGWVWTRLGEITENITSGSRNWKNFYSENGASFIRSQDIKFDRLEYDNRVFVDVFGNEEGTRTKVKYGDWLITITGGNVGRCAYLANDPGLAYVNQHVALMRPIQLNIGKFGHLWLIAEYGGRGLLRKSIYGDKPGLNLDQLRSMIFPLPSLAEQQVIVNQVDKLLTIVDELESHVKNQKNYVEELMQAVLREAFERRVS